MNAPTDPPAEHASARHELNEIHAGLSRALAGAERLKAHGGLSNLSQSVAAMLADDVAMAGKRVRWLRAALDRRAEEGGGA